MRVGYETATAVAVGAKNDGFADDVDAAAAAFGTELGGSAFAVRH